MMDRVFKKFANIFWDVFQDRVDRDIMSYAPDLGPTESDVDKFTRRLEALSPVFKRFVKKIDTVEEFVKDECVLLDHGKIESHFLYRCYKAWCLNNGMRPLSRSVFCKRLLGCYPRSIEFRAEKYSSGYFMGITVAEKEKDL